MSFSVDLLPAFADNYIYLVSDNDIGLAMVVDPGDADVVERELKKKDLHLSLILNTHHHKDHVGGSEKLQKLYGCAIIGPTKERNRITNMSRTVGQGDSVTFSTLRGKVIETHGHTAGHIAFYFPEIKALFCGDTLFSLGCGRLFEGTAAEMWHSLKALRALPDDTLIYCGHEYTEANAKFALALDKNNVALQARAQQVHELRKQGKPTLPSVMAMEKQTNPFLRVDLPEFHQALAKSGLPLQGTDPAALFGTIRSAKDRFGTNN
ncbi:MAG TPA: hydroxyacylglutathione hydrolase [Alphaproteobacteria bacterium]|nr:hydroxyacylglutathione hydrolase [Alphaproteobacteria bacterium]